MTPRNIERHTAKRSSTPDPWGGRTTVYAVEPHGLRDATRVLLGRYDARVWVENTSARNADMAESRYVG